MVNGRHCARCMMRVQRRWMGRMAHRGLVGVRWSPNRSSFFRAPGNSPSTVRAFYFSIFFTYSNLGSNVDVKDDHFRRTFEATDVAVRRFSATLPRSTSAFGGVSHALFLPHSFALAAIIQLHWIVAVEHNHLHPSYQACLNAAIDMVAIIDVIQPHDYPLLELHIGVSGTSSISCHFRILIAVSNTRRVGNSQQTSSIASIIDSGESIIQKLGSITKRSKKFRRRLASSARSSLCSWNSGERRMPKLNLRTFLERDSYVHCPCCRWSSFELCYLGPWKPALLPSFYVDALSLSRRVSLFLVLLFVLCSFNRSLCTCFVELGLTQCILLAASIFPTPFAIFAFLLCFPLRSPKSFLSIYLWPSSSTYLVSPTRFDSIRFLFISYSFISTISLSLIHTFSLFLLWFKLHPNPSFPHGHHLFITIRFAVRCAS